MSNYEKPEYKLYVFCLFIFLMFKNLGFLVITTSKMIFMLNFFYFILAYQKVSEKRGTDAEIQSEVAYELMQKFKAYFKTNADISEFIVL